MDNQSSDAMRRLQDTAYSYYRDIGTLIGISHEHLFINQMLYDYYELHGTTTECDVILGMAGVLKWDGDN